MSKEAPISLYKVNDVIERMDLDKKGVFSRMIEIQATTKSGIDFTLQMSKVKYTKEAAQKRLELEARRLEDTLNLKQ